MPEKFLDSNMRLRLKSPVDGLVATGVSGTEEISRLFAFDVDLRCVEPFEFAQILGKKVTLELDSESSELTRYFNGYVTDLRQTGYALDANGSYHHTKYQATLRPWFWMLTQTSDCRVFQKGVDGIDNVPDIVKKVFRDNGMSAFEDRLTGTYRDWIYCVQYRESDFNFLSRLMENEGIYYYFTHKDGEHTLVLVDDVNSLQPFEGVDKLMYHSTGGRKLRQEHLDHWIASQTVQPYKYAQRDYDFEKPKVKLESKNESQKDHDHKIPEPEIYDWTGEYIEQEHGDEYVKKRLEELQCHHERISTGGPCYTLSAGSYISLEEHELVDEADQFLVLSVQHAIQNPGFLGSGSEGQESYQASAQLMPFTKAGGVNQQFRPARLTPRPVIQGVQSAVVVGPSSEEIYCDEYGRVKIQFHWDRYGNKDENSSCWVRVSQAWAGKDWGSVHIPRIGQEVLVSFLEGDPDQPIITGRVFNADQATNYALEANKSQSGIKSRSTPGGGPDNFNEIRMEDKMGSEQLYIQAEKDEKILVKNDKTEDVNHNETVTIGNDRVETVQNNETLTVVMDRTRTVMNNETVNVSKLRNHSVGLNELITVGLAQEVAVGAYQQVTVGAYQQMDVGAYQNITVGAWQTLDAGSTQSFIAGKHQEHEIADDRNVDIGNDDNLKVKKKLIYDIGDKATFKCGKAELIMAKNGNITLKGKDIVLDASGKAQIKARSNLILKGSVIKEN